MGSKRGLQSGVDGVDVAYVLTAFQEINQCTIEMRAGALQVGRASVLRLELIANDASAEIGAAPPLGSVRLEIGYHNPISLESAILQALYRLDADLQAQKPALVSSE